MSKVGRLLELILILTDHSAQFKKESLLEKLAYGSESSFKRDLKTIRESGIKIEIKNNYYHINVQESEFHSHSNLKFIHDLRENLKGEEFDRLSAENKQKHIQHLVDNLRYDTILEAFVAYDDIQLMLLIREAIHVQKSVTLVGYSSSASQRSHDREVEPFEIVAGSKMFWAYEPRSNSNKLYKISRTQDVILRGEWQHTAEHQSQAVDIFGLSSEHCVDIQMRLTRTAYNLILEETTVSKSELSPQAQDKFLLNIPIRNILGFKRFYLGLQEEIELIYPKTLADIEEKFLVK